MNQNLRKNKLFSKRNSLPLKGHFYITGYLHTSVTRGLPTEYFYRGHLIRTSAVQEILEANEEFITFETLNSIYTISYSKVPAEFLSPCA